MSIDVTLRTKTNFIVITLQLLSDVGEKQFKINNNTMSITHIELLVIISIYGRYLFFFFF